MELMERGWEGKGLQDLTTGDAQGVAQLFGRAVERETGSAVALKNLNFVEELENDESAAALKNGVETTAVDITEGVLNGTNTNVMDNETESAVVAALKNCVDDCICSDGESVAAAALKNDVCETANARGAAEIADEDQNCMRSESESESQSESQSQSQSQNQSQSGNRQARDGLCQAPCTIGRRSGSAGTVSAPTGCALGGSEPQPQWRGVRGGGAALSTR
jgi:hypothetical protein